MTNKTTDWPEYCYIAKRAYGKWTASVQNKNGQTFMLDYKDPMMAEAAAKKHADKLGVEKDLEVFWNDTDK